MEDFYRPPLIARGGAIVPGTDFVLKNHMVQLLRQNCQFHGFEGEDANEHLDKYLSITQFIKQKRISQDIINLNLFLFSLTHEAESWFYTLKTHSIHTWEDMVFKFLSKYFPYSRTLQLKTEILNFWQLPTESVFESWERFKSCLQKCLDHRILLLNQILTFYNGITIIDQERLMVAAGDNFMRKTPQEAYDLIKNMTQHHFQWDAEVYYNTTTDMSAHYFETTFASRERVKDILTPFTDDEPSEMIEDQKSIYHLSGSLTPSSDPMVASLSPSLTPIGDSDSILEETDTLLPHHDSTLPKVYDDIFNPEGDIRLLKRLLNLDSTKDLPPPHELNNEIFDPKGDILILENLFKDDPSEAKNSGIASLIKGPSDTFLMGDEDIKLNPPIDIDNLIPIPRVSEKPLDSLDPILETFKMTITNPFFDLDSEFTLNLDNPILDIQNKESDESETETIMDEVIHIEKGAKTGIYGFVSIKSAKNSRSRQSHEKSPSMPLEKALENEFNDALRSYWASPNWEVSYERPRGDRKSAISFQFAKYENRTVIIIAYEESYQMGHLQDYWWRVNDHECSPFTNWRDHIRGPYADYYSNAHDEEEQKDEERCELFDDPAQEPPICKIRRFEMIKYSFGQEEEYVAIKEYEYDDLTRTNDDASYAYQEIFHNMDEGWLVTRAE
ncbi:reverse transcriptase domain-containing protein [Tanacetum coccineum]|uniref:Reverse transcriptase domain-containing protein n=1 Tax=Tanacetum coccineum TaxID=301880 RepID=A0ABQ5FA65_9ASTR